MRKNLSASVLSIGPNFAKAPRRRSHDDYGPMLEAITRQFQSGGSHGRAHLFTTDVSGEKLWQSYLNTMELTHRQQHNCHECRRFVEKYGNLVWIDEDGKLESALWGLAPGIYSGVFDTLAHKVEKAKVTGVFLSSEKVWGTPKTPDPKRNEIWRHMSVLPPLPYRNTLKTAEQAMAEKLEEYGMVCRALDDYPQPVVEKAMLLVNSDAMYRSEKIAGPLRWFADLQVQTFRKVRGINTKARTNKIWRAVAAAPPGFAHIRSGMTGTLLDDLAGGKSYEDAVKSFAAKMSPLAYMRPQAPPSAGTILQANKIFEKLEASGALKRRFARLEDLRPLWTPTRYPGIAAQTTGLFDGLLPKTPTTFGVAGGPITWTKFRDSVLPKAQSIQVQAPSHGSYCAFVTAEDPGAPPILQWDFEGSRNPVSWYFYSQGSGAYQWGLSGGQWVPVTAVTLNPPQWGPHFANQAEGAAFILQGCKDTGQSGIALFPEILKSDLHGIRSVLEAYSARGRISGQHFATACGVGFSKGPGKAPINLRVRVTTSLGVTEYTIDRWD